MEQINLLDLSPTEIQSGQFEEGDRVQGTQVLPGLIHGGTIFGVVQKIGCKYLRLDTGDIFRTTCRRATSCQQLKVEAEPFIPSQSQANGTHQL